MVTCEFVVDWKLADDGESPGAEFYCTREATHVDENGTRCCSACGARQQAEGFTVAALAVARIGGAG